MVLVKIKELLDHRLRLDFLSLCHRVLVDILKHELAQINHCLLDLRRHHDIILIPAVHNNIMYQRVEALLGGKTERLSEFKRNVVLR